MATRRTLLQGALAALGLGASGMSAFAATERKAKPLDILVLGGTGFIGPHQIEYALARGHKITMFNRGRTAAGLYGNRVETLLGNRDAKIGPGLKSLQGRRRWDVVIDNSGYVPRHVRDSAELLRGRVGRYLYVSTISTYELAQGGVFNENSPLQALSDPSDEQVTNASYGPLKAACDHSVREILGAAATVVRPTYIVGPGDDTDRFTYWVDRTARGGDVLSPPNASEALQWIDVRDLAAWMIGLAENDTGGIFNAASRPAPWSDILATLAAAARKSVRLRGPTQELLDLFRIELPLVATDMAPWMIGTAAAEAAGLTVRPLLNTARDTLEWWNSLPAERRSNPDGWPTPQQERQALERLRRI
ncbi:MAG: NAD-dependent epimerase/dehydratase family protein [Steroidobacteraceae bacterium]